MTNPLIKTSFGNEGTSVDERDATGTGVASYALDAANAQRLWDVSEALLRRA